MEQTNPLNTLFDPTQGDQIRFPPFFVQDHGAKRIRQKMDISHEGMGQERVTLLHFSPAFQKNL
jgi:hypothetical protein